MKALIVDDEKHVREGIKLLANWEGNGITEIYEASNGEDAIQMIQSLHPEIIFSDMKMPKVDGTQLLQWMDVHYTAGKTIVVTGYDDYHYMRKAMHYGSSDYLLKPINPEMLNDTLVRVVKEWKQEEKERKNKLSKNQLINKMKPAYRDQKLTHIINNDLVDKKVWEEFHLEKAQIYTIGLLQVSDIAIEQFNGDKNLTLFTLLNIINDELSKDSNGIAFHYVTSKGEIILLLKSRREESTYIIKKIHTTIQKLVGLSCTIAVGKEVDSVTQLNLSYQHAKTIMMNRNVLRNHKEKIIMENGEKEFKSLMAYTSSIKLAIQTGELEPFRSLIGQIQKDIISKQQLSFRQLLHFENEYQMISSRWHKEFNLPFSMPTNLEERIYPFIDKEDIFQLEAYKDRKKREIALFLRRIKRQNTRKSRNVIHEIEKYVTANYHREIKLQEISEHFYISREYISRKFKQEYQINISEYLVAIRIKKAQELLRSSNLKVYDIANMIGYQDDKYFRKVFKKIVGVSPNEFREMKIERE
ncbi:response regulator containing a CheY-like receiver domain and an HTH DNA-binding domain [Mycobacteroides abscessus subsp. abscessus]|nr:response regulator containing a CheY-like receiver domain and an HTH DNA-binding domain [Mycobacteroides abscessus subsp. abscessus]